MIPSVFRSLRDWDAAVRIWSASSAWRQSRSTFGQEGFSCCFLHSLRSTQEGFSENSPPGGIRRSTFAAKLVDADPLPQHSEWRGPEPGSEAAEEVKRTFRHYTGLGAPYRSLYPQIRAPPTSDFSHAFPSGEIRIGKDSNIRLSGAAIAGLLRKEGTGRVLAAGVEAVNQAVKSFVLARQYIRERNEGDVCFKINHLFRHDRNSSNQIMFVGKRVQTPFSIGENADVNRCKSVCNVLSVGTSMAASLKRYQASILKAIGAGAAASAVVSMTWARRNLLQTGFDMECYPEFVLLKMDDGKEVHGLRFLLNLTEDGEAKSNSVKELAAVDHLKLKISAEELLDCGEAFSNFSTKSLPVVKVAKTSLGTPTAAVIVSQLRFYPGVHVLSTGLDANNQAFKALCVSRIYVNEHPGYDFGFQCIHAPPQNDDGICQLSTWGLLVKARQTDTESEEFRLNFNTSAKSMGAACGYRIRKGERVTCVGMGISCVSKMLVALSFARSFVERSGIDVIGFPLFDNVHLKQPDGSLKRVVRFKLEMVPFKRDR
ncbi:hypothetical protein BSKO_00292 [Bryopsis sp. KO-2023]|nr:hypothetical protein BSKO_00292 [Bryopsis sp. KO-2023]